MNKKIDEKDKSKEVVKSVKKSSYSKKKKAKKNISNGIGWTITVKNFKRR